MNKRGLEVILGFVNENQSWLFATETVSGNRQLKTHTQIKSPRDLKSHFHSHNYNQTRPFISQSGSMFAASD